MDEFLKQFLIEARDLVEQAIENLLALEKAPDDKESFDDAFRAFHTLKGGAGIVEFAAMETAIHAAENVLSAARSSERPMSTLDITNCLMCLDQVGQWLDTLESTGALPANAEPAAAAVVAHFAASNEGEPRPAPSTRQAADDDWLRAALGRHPEAAKRASTAIRYRPDADAFFRNYDPVALVATLPGLLAVDIGPRVPWAPLEDLDPFSCNLVITALISGARAAAVTALGDEARNCDVESLDDAAPSSVDALPQYARDVLAAQLALLAEVGGRHEAGRVASAAVVAANVLRHIGDAAAADRLAGVAAASLTERPPLRLRQEIEAALERKPAPPPIESAPAGGHDLRTQTIRVDAARIDALVRLTGELTVAKNAIGHAVKLADAEGAALAITLKNRHAALDRLVGELQRSVLGMRVLPLRIAFQRFPRLIREMAADLRKPATLIVEGEDTEADKAIVEVLVEPLVHVLRNAMDHGVEDAAARAAAGKPAVATIRLRAFRQGEHVVIEVADDGGGIDVARVRQVAKERNVLPEATLDAMSDAEVFDLIFAPGFSTAAKVTDLSGRGVGMDVVRTAVSRLGGHVEADSTTGRGTTIRFTLPFSVMMIQVMTVEAGGQTFGIPLDAIVETLRIPAASIFAVGATHAIVLRDRTVPVLNLAGVLGTSSKQGHDEDSSLVVAKVNGDLGALRVDKVGERMEVMLKPLDGLLAGTPGIAGSTLLGDGSVLLVLNLGELLQ